MDAIELGRRRASELHDTAVARGLDPTQPYAFAVGEAANRGLDVEKAAPGHASLDKGRATLIPEDDLIIHEDAGTAFEQAFLVAHEIGHHELGDAEVPPTALDSDMTRASEPSPTGIDRVVDYGRRQRREVQMDLFARELLLPRGLVRRMHVDENLSASDIALRMGAPAEVVAQQLFDALLLPVIAPIDRVKNEHPLNKAQADAAEHRGKPYLLEAGPGTGKTQTLTARVVQLLDEKVDPRRILVLTYSNKAAGEMAERIADKAPDKAAAMWIGTFHAFGLDLIRRLSDEFDLPPNPRMMDRVEAVELLEAEFPRLGLLYYRDLYNPTQLIGDILAAISRAKDEVVGSAAYAKFAEEMKSAAGGVEPKYGRALEAAEVGQVYEVYERLKRSHRALDFGDLVARPVELFERRPDIAKTIADRYDHILVDEYQDVNRASVRLLKALRPSGANLWVVGDARQSIYRFRGASPQSTAMFASHDFPGARSGRLEINYRSVEEVVSVYSSFANGMTASSGPSFLKANRGRSGNPVELRLLAGKEDQSTGIADAIGDIKKTGIPYREQAVLCTGNERLGEIARDLERMDIPVLFLGSLFERPEVKDLLAMLSLLSDPRAMGLVRVATMPEFEMSLADVGAVLEELRATDGAPLDWLERRAVLPISDCGRRALDRLADALRDFDADTPPWRLLSTLLLDRTRIAARIAVASSITVRAKGIALWQLMNFVRVQPNGPGKPVPRFLDRIRRLVAIGDDRDLRQLPAAAQGLDAVRLMTIHGSKGLEFDCVHLPGLNGDTLPGTAKAPQCLPPEGVIAAVSGDVREALRVGDAEERECLFYVATSRARDRLFLYAAKVRSDGARRPLSAFLDRLGSGISRSEPTLRNRLEQAAESRPIELEIEGPMRFRDSQIAMLEKDKCKRRFFYTHVLGIGGRRTETDFMRMHEAARSVVRAIVRDELAFVNEAELRAIIEQACDDQGLDAAGTFVELRKVAIELVQSFRTLRAAHVAEAPSALVLAVGSDQIVFTPDDVLSDARGMRKFQRVRTGVHRKADTQDLGAAIALLAVADNHPSSAVEVVHLSSGTVSPLSLSSKVLGSRRSVLADVMADIRSGHFPSKPTQRVCPRCPAFFVCGEIPVGSLSKVF